MNRVMGLEHVKKKYALDFYTTRVNENLMYQKGLHLIYVFTVTKNKLSH